VAPDQGLRCVFDNEWTLEDTIQTPSHQGKWRIRAASHGPISSIRGSEQPSASSSTMSLRRPETVATIRWRRVRPDGSRRVQRRLPPEEIEELVAAYLAGATALALAGKHSIHRTTVLALLERHQVARRGRVLTPDHIKRAVSSYASGRSCASIGKEFHVNPETVRQALLKAGVAMRTPGRPRTTKGS